MIMTTRNVTFIKGEASEIREDDNIRNVTGGKKVLWFARSY
jgi:hypothetical protein